MQWLRRSFIAGFFVVVPLFISVAAFLWLFRLVDGFVGPFYIKYLGRNLPGLGILTTALAVLLVGAIATNVVGKRLLQRAEWLLLHVPLNHLYLGDIVICPRDRVSYPDVTVEQGIRIFLTGGMALAGRMRARRGDDRVGDFRV